jgi:hypothetical protein
LGWPPCAINTDRLVCRQSELSQERLISGTIRSTVVRTQACGWRIAHGPDLA